MEQEIKEAKYEGYFWMSDQSQPVVLYGDQATSIVLKDGENPFVAEALLWDQENKVSVSVRYADGHYFVATRLVREEQLDNAVTPVTYLPHRLPQVRGLHFLRLWKQKKDPLCEDMETLELEANVFVGFEK